MDNQRKVVKNSVFLFLPSLTRIIVGLFITVLVARELGEENYGIYMFLVSTVGLMMVFSDLGLNDYFIKETAREKSFHKKYFWTIFIAKTGLSVIVFGLILLFLQVTGKGDIIRFAIPVAFFLLLNQLSSFFMSIMRGHEDMKYESIIDSADKILFSIITFYFITIGLLDLSTYIIINLVNYIAISGLRFAITSAKDMIPKFSLHIRQIPKLIKTSKAFAANWLFSSLYHQVDVLAIGLMLSNSAVGIYSVGFKLLEYLTMIPDAYRKGSNPTFHRLFKEDKKELRKLISTSSVFFNFIAIPIIAYTLIYAGNIMDFLFPESFMESRIIMQIIIFALFFIFIRANLSNLILSSKKPEHLGYILLGTTALNLILDIILISFFGIIGAAIATLSMEIFFVGMLLIYAKKFKIKLNFFKKIHLFILYTGISLTTRLFIPNWFIAFASGGIIYLLLCLATRTISLKSMIRTTNPRR
ncbi:MAG: flippase [Candidatus Woesearchaeota archaeon]